MTHEEQNAIRDRAHDAIMAATGQGDHEVVCMPFLCRLGLHKWTRWSALLTLRYRDYETKETRHVHGQKRICVKCGEVNYRGVWE